MLFELQSQPNRQLLLASLSRTYVYIPSLACVLQESECTWIEHCSVFSFFSPLIVLLFAVFGWRCFCCCFQLCVASEHWARNMRFAFHFYFISIAVDREDTQRSGRHKQGKQQRKKTIINNSVCIGHEHAFSFFFSLFFIFWIRTDQQQPATNSQSSSPTNDSISTFGFCRRIFIPSLPLFGAETKTIIVYLCWASSRIAHNSNIIAQMIFPFLEYVCSQFAVARHTSEATNLLVRHPHMAPSAFLILFFSFHPICQTNRHCLKWIFFFTSVFWRKKNTPKSVSAMRRISSHRQFEQSRSMPLPSLTYLYDEN